MADLGAAFSPPQPFRPLSRRSSCVSAEPYPPLRCDQSTANFVGAKSEMMSVGRTKLGAAGAAPPFRPLSRRSGRIPAWPYPPLRCFQSGSTTASPPMLLQRAAITPLARCLIPGVHFTVQPLSPPQQTVAPERDQRSGLRFSFCSMPAIAACLMCVFWIS